MEARVFVCQLYFPALKCNIICDTFAIMCCDLLVTSEMHCRVQRASTSTVWVACHVCVFCVLSWEGANTTLGNETTSRAAWESDDYCVCVYCCTLYYAIGRQHHHLNLIALCFGNGCLWCGDREYVRICLYEQTSRRHIYIVTGILAALTIFI